MRLILARAAIVSLFLLLSGCAGTQVEKSSADVEPATYEVGSTAPSHSVGVLRRLAVLPIRVEISPDEKYCFEGCGHEWIRDAVANSAVRYLIEHRAYEVVSLDPRVPNYQESEITLQELERDSDILVSWAEKRSNADTPSDDVSKLIRNLGQRFNVDGIVVLHGSVIALSKLDVISWYATFSLSFPITMLRAHVTLQADIYEVSGSRLVWSSKYSERGGDITSDKIARRLNTGEKLFEPLEPALPAHFR